MSAAGARRARRELQRDARPPPHPPVAAEAHLRRPHAVGQQHAPDRAPRARDVDSRAWRCALRANPSIVAAAVESSTGTAEKSMT